MAAVPRLDFAPLERLLNRIAACPDAAVADGDINTSAVARLAGVNTRQVYRWREVGISIWRADRLCVAVGRHPAELWPREWSTAAGLEVA